MSSFFWTEIIAERDEINIFLFFLHKSRKTSILPVDIIPFLLVDTEGGDKGEDKECGSGTVEHVTDRRDGVEFIRLRHDG